MARLNWETEAESALKRVPVFVRPLVRRKVEDRVRKGGCSSVTLAHFQEAEARFRAVTAGRSEQELKDMLPRENKPGTETVVITACHNQLSNCPNVLIDTSEINDILRDGLADREVSERVRSRLSEDRVLFHHKLKISIAGCPNGCSRPQIADFGLIGTIKPLFDTADCTHCGACAETCPDAAIAMIDDLPEMDPERCQGCLKCSQACLTGCIAVSRPALRLTAGGKLGRHPHLADEIGEVRDGGQALEVIGREVEDYLVTSRTDERFANWRLRSRGAVDAQHKRGAAK